MNLKSFLSLVSVSTIVLTIGFSSQATAEEKMKFTGTPAEVLEQGLFQHGKNSMENMNLLDQVHFILGTPEFFRGNYSEIAIERDDRNVNSIYLDLMAQQNTLDPYLRVPDLPNPYNTSLMTLPSLQTGRVIGSELVYDRLPLP